MLSFIVKWDFWWVVVFLWIISDCVVLFNFLEVIVNVVFVLFILLFLIKVLKFLIVVCIVDLVWMLWVWWVLVVFICLIVDLMFGICFIFWNDNNWDYIEFDIFYNKNKRYFIKYKDRM